MSSKITTPNGLRIPIEDIGPYIATNFPGELPKIIIARRGVSGERAEEVVRFDTIEERDAFLARLDNYFQEIP